MTKKEKLKWRLTKLPTVDEIALLVTQSVLTKDEAREILFSLETDEDRDVKSLQEEIKFLRELVTKLSTNRSQIIDSIRSFESPVYIKQPWWEPYQFYCSSGISVGGSSNANSITNGLLNTTTTTTATYSSAMESAGDFRDIKTF